jgi:hypothetical protein
MRKHEQILGLLPIDLKHSLYIPASPVNEAIIIHAIGGDRNYGVWLRVGRGAWYKLEETDKNYDMVADAILNRLNEPVQP